MLFLHYVIPFYSYLPCHKIIFAFFCLFFALFYKNFIFLSYIFSIIPFLPPPLPIKFRKKDWNYFYSPVSSGGTGIHSDYTDNLMKRALHQSEAICSSNSIKIAMAGL